MTCNPGPDLKHDVNRLDEPPLNILPEKGVYTVIIHVVKEEKMCIGSLGVIDIVKGFYAYTGSGLGRGTLSLRGRVLRHLTRRKKLKWHIDYLTSSKSSIIVGVVASQVDKKFECMIASAINSLTKYVKGFGCSDCKCSSHLALLPLQDVDGCINFIKNVYINLGLTPTSITFSS
ncbi:MAG: GIY-YIG nuclease family protein [Candidatus Nezhaarchaeales archaeon]